VTEVAPVPATRRPRHRLRYTVIALLCIGAVIWMLMLMQKNVVFFKTVSQAVKAQHSDGSRTMRIGGGVVAKSIQDRNDGVDFQLTEGGQTVTIHHTGTEPQLFRDCAPVVAEGHWDTNTTNTFDSTRLLIKHDNNYEAPTNTGVCPKDPFK
jgi:cytochrome c-type biogenesis protein CcmE